MLVDSIVPKVELLPLSGLRIKEVFGVQPFSPNLSFISYFLSIGICTKSPRLLLLLCSAEG